MNEPEIMNDGTQAWLTPSERYYVRREKDGVPEINKWTKIVYYTLEKEHIPLAKAQCGECKEVIESPCCGAYVVCPCSKSAVDTDRWMPERHRYIGAAEPLKS